MNSQSCSLYVQSALFAFCGFVRARARVAMAKVTGTKDVAPLDLRTENELVVLFTPLPVDHGSVDGGSVSTATTTG